MVATNDIIDEVRQQEAEKQIIDQTKRIDYYLTEYSVEMLAAKMSNGDFEVPDYQREYTWEEERKWKFIESILMNLPIPFLFFWENPKSGKLEIVDGSQRLRTIEEFISGDLVLGELDKLNLLSNFSFNDLTESRQRKLKNRSIRGIILNEHADEEARFALFERINTGSKVANKAEVRRGALGGPFLTMVIDLATHPKFINLAPVSDKQLKEREREELVTRFFAYSDGLDEYADEVSAFLFAYSKRMNDSFINNPKLKASYEQRFLKMIEFIEASFPYGFRRTLKGKVSPRSRFEAISVGTFRALNKKVKLKVNTKKVSLWVEGAEFSKIIGADGANAISRLEGRINYVMNKLLES